MDPIDDEIAVEDDTSSGDEYADDTSSGYEYADDTSSGYEYADDTSSGDEYADDKTGLGGVNIEDSSGSAKPASASSTAGLEGKGVLDLIGKKVDPAKKAKKYFEKRFKKNRDSLVESVFEGSNVKRAERLASAEPAPVTKKAVGMLNKLTNASGKAPGSADSFVERSATKVISHLEKSSGATRELLESGGDIARAIAGGTKNSKNLRLAGAASLFAAAGYGIGKVKDHGKDIRKREQRVEPDKEQQLRQSLLNDG